MPKFCSFVNFILFFFDNDISLEPERTSRKILLLNWVTNLKRNDWDFESRKIEIWTKKHNFVTISTILASKFWKSVFKFLLKYYNFSPADRRTRSNSTKKCRHVSNPYEKYPRDGIVTWHEMFGISSEEKLKFGQLFTENHKFRYDFDGFGNFFQKSHLAKYPKISLWNFSSTDFEHVRAVASAR